ncbi:MAG: L-threonylcarbamoyladenylate synthase [Pseudomonadota bacterium]
MTEDPHMSTADGPMIAAAAARIGEGRLVAFPTETVYGLGADATDPAAVARLYETKGRPQFNPLIAHLPDAGRALDLIEVLPALRSLAEAAWPGPLTVVGPVRPGCPVCDLARAGLATLAVRVPDHPVAHALLEAVGRPVAAPSANLSGHVSATTAEHVRHDFPSEADVMVLDGGAAVRGLESTIVAPDGDGLIVLREGALTREAIAEIIGFEVAVRDRAAGNARPDVPGQLASHYAPAARVLLNCRRPPADAALLAFGPVVPPHRGPSENLSTAGDLSVAAQNLFAALRRLDASGARTIAVMPVPDIGLGAAINDRLRRAAAPR